MTKAPEHLEAERLERAFEEFKRVWWWCDSANDREKDEAAQAWETLRRTKFYPALWRKCIRARSVFLGNEGKPALPKSLAATATSVRSKLSEVFRLCHLVGRAKQATSDLFFAMILNGFDPSLNWLKLSLVQRLSARGYTVRDGVATRINDGLKLPRQAAPISASLELGVCEIARNAKGEWVVSKSLRYGGEIELVAKTPFFQNLKLKPGRWLYVYFDTTDSREALLKAWDQNMDGWLNLLRRENEPRRSWQDIAKQNQSFPTHRKLQVARDGKEVWVPADFWTPDTLSPHIHSKPGDVHLIPSDWPHWAILLLNARHNPFTFRAAFQTQLKTQKRRDWVPRCVTHWETVKVEVEMVVPKADGTVEIDCRGFPVLTKVTRYLLDPKQPLTSEPKPGKSAGRADLWLGLAANDVVRQKNSLFKRIPETDFLIPHCNAWRAYCERAKKTAKQDYSQQRKARYKSSHELRNHQKSAKNRLDELDEMFGRLDKNLGHWIKENTKLAQSRFFLVAAGKGPRKPAVTSKTSDSEMPPKRL